MPAALRVQLTTEDRAALERRYATAGDDAISTGAQGTSPIAPGPAVPQRCPLRGGRSCAV
jgi:hypothetical protein